MDTTKHYCNLCNEEISFIEYMEQQSCCDGCIEAIYSDKEETTIKKGF